MPAPRSSRLQPTTSIPRSDPSPHRRTAKPGFGSGGCTRSSSSSSASARSGSANQRKLGTRITDLQSRLGQAQKELKDLKGQLSVPAVPTAKTGARNGTTTSRPVSASSRRSPVEEKRVDTERRRTDVFEVPSSKSDEPAEPEQMLSRGPVLKQHLVTSLRSKLEERAEELRAASTARESLRSQLAEATGGVSSARNKQEETGSRLTQAGEELQSSRENILQLKKNLEGAEAAKRALEEEMKELSLQTEKWKAAADAAAQVLAEGAEKEAMRASGMRGSIDNNFLSILFETPPLDSCGEVAGDSGREYPRSSGSRAFADLWKWKGLK